MRILAIDLGTKCGWALQIDKRKAKYGSLNLAKNSPFDGCGMQYIKFKKWLHEQLPLDLIVYEAVMAHDARAVHAQHKYGGFLATIQTFADEYEVPYSGEAVGSIKKYWLGVGTKTKNKKVGKEQMLAEARNRGFNPANDDEADALALLHMGIHEYELFM